MKQKTHSGTKKRVRVTGSGKLMRQQTGMRHNLGKYATRIKRRLNEDKIVSPKDLPRLSKLLKRSFSK